MPTTLLVLASAISVLAQGLPQLEVIQPDPAPISIPGQAYQFEVADAVAEGAPLVYSHFPSAGPGESLYLRGEGLAGPEPSGLILWGPDPAGGSGRRYDAKVQSAQQDCLLATLPESASDGLFIAWPTRGETTGHPVRINAPEAWWLAPDRVLPGDVLRVFGRNVGRRPSGETGHVWAVGPNGGRWLQVSFARSESLEVSIPEDTSPGKWRLWVHAGFGGKYGWSDALEFEVSPAEEEPRVLSATDFGVVPDDGKDDLSAIAKALQAADKNGVVMLPPGVIDISAPLVLGDGVTVAGLGAGATLLQLSSSVAPNQFPSIPTERPSGPAIGRIHSVGDYLKWEVNVPQDGAWNVWLFYAADNSPWGVETMAGHTQMQVDDNPPVDLQNLPNTGSFSDFKWSKCAQLDLTAGAHVITWRNATGGGLNFDKFALSLPEDWQPAEGDMKNANDLLIVEAESFTDAQARDWSPPQRPVVLINGNDVGLADISVLGSPCCNSGILIADSNDVSLIGLDISDIPANSGDGAALQVLRGQRVSIESCKLRGRTPVLLQHVDRVTVRGCSLTPVHGYENGALGAILGRPAPITHCIIEGNSIHSGSGTPEAMRLLWWSTEGGSVADNWIAGNEGANFSGQPGGDQNVGEAMLFETNLTHPYYGPPTASGPDFVELPEDGPDWSMFADLPQGRYCAVIVDGPGTGQARQVTGVADTRLTVDRPWRVQPTTNSTVLISEQFMRNHVVDNRIDGGMTGVQFWINGIENIIAGNQFSNLRREGILVFGMVSDLATTQRPGWNSGIGTIFYNSIENNAVSKSAYGIRVNVGQAMVGGAPTPWPQALGNTVRHNTVRDSRQSGLGADLRYGGTIPDEPELNPVLDGTIFEWNHVTDSPTAVTCGDLADDTLVRQNHMYFWSTPTDGSVGIGISSHAGNVINEANNFEGPFGMTDDWIQQWVKDE